VAQSRRQAGLIKASLLAALTVVLVIGALLVTSMLRQGPVERVLARLEAVRSGTGLTEMTAYAGTVESSMFGKVEVFFMPPDRRLVRLVASGVVHGTNGEVWWCYVPSKSTAHLGDQPDSWPGFQNLEPQWPFSLWTQVLTRFNRRLERGGSFHKIILLGTEKVLGRDTHVIEARPTEPHGNLFPDVLRIWVDAATSLVLKEVESAPDGTLFRWCEFTSLDLTPRFDPGMFDPHFPEGTTIVRHKTGTLEELIAEVGEPVRRPEGLPPDAYVDRAYLTVTDGTGDGETHWELRWYYRPLIYFGTTGGELAVRVSNQPLETPSSTPETVELAAGVNGALYMLGTTHGGSVYFTAGGLSYELSCRALSRDELLSVARSMFAGE